MISLKNKEEIKILREGGHILAEIIKELSKDVQPGINADKLDEKAEKLAKKNNAIPSFKNYNGFPANICVSKNNEVVHGFPFDKILEEGDIVGLDYGLKYKGLYTDHAITMGVGKISKKARKLIKVTKKSLEIGIKQISPGLNLGVVSNSIQTYVESHNYSIVRDLTGHGVGHKVHESPQVPNFGNKNDGPIMQAGLVIAIEPMVNIGGHQIKLNKDSWTIVTSDNTLSAHFEHTVLVTEDGFEILTK